MFDHLGHSLRVGDGGRHYVVVVVCQLVVIQIVEFDVVWLHEVCVEPLVELGLVLRFGLEDRFAIGIVVVTRHECNTHEQCNERHCNMFHHIFIPFVRYN